MENILDKIQDFVKESLPQATASELKKYFEDQNKINIELEALKESERNNLKKLDEYSKKEKEYDKIKSKEEHLNEEFYRLDQERISHEENVRNLKVEKLEYQLKEASKRSDEIFKLVETLVKNPRSTEFWSSNKNTQTPYTDQYGNRLSDFQSINETISRDIEETK